MIRKECYILTVKSRFDCSNIKTKKVNEKKRQTKVTDQGLGVIVIVKIKIKNKR